MIMQHYGYGQTSPFFGRFEAYAFFDYRNISYIAN